MGQGVKSTSNWFFFHLPAVGFSPPLPGPRIFAYVGDVASRHAHGEGDDILGEGEASSSDLDGVTSHGKNGG